jgi:hypothetical protein
MLTMIMIINAKIKLVNRSVTDVWSDSIFAHRTVVKNPVINPAIIPFLVVFFHHNVKTSAGPNADPSPLQA